MPGDPKDSEKQKTTPTVEAAYIEEIQKMQRERQGTLQTLKLLNQKNIMLSVWKKTQSLIEQLTADLAQTREEYKKFEELVGEVATAFKQSESEKRVLEKDLHEAHVTTQKLEQVNGKGFLEPWKFPASSVEIPMQKCWGKASTPSVPLNVRQKLQVKNTFLELGSQGGSENSNEEPKFMSWTDERAGLVYGSYQHLQEHRTAGLPHHRTPSARSKSCSSVPSQVSSDTGPISSVHISSDTGPISSDFSSEGGPTSDMLVVLGGRVEGKKESEVHLSEIQQVPLHPITGEITSIGSAGHFCGSCRPCEWMQRGRPCKYGWRCTYCHIIDEHTSFHRKKKTRPNGKQPPIPRPCSTGAGSLVNSSAYKIAL